MPPPPKYVPAKDYRGMSYIGKKFERKLLQHFSGIRSGLKISDFLHIRRFLYAEAKDSWSRR